MLRSWHGSVGGAGCPVIERLPRSIAGTAALPARKKWDTPCLRAWPGEFGPDAHRAATGFEWP